VTYGYNWQTGPVVLGIETDADWMSVNANGRSRTKGLPLKDSDLRELLPFLDQHPIGARLILRGIRRNGSRLVIINK
jgi:hypothetical protein